MLTKIKSLYLTSIDAYGLAYGEEISSQVNTFQKCYIREYGPITWQFSDEESETVDDLMHKFAKCRLATLYADVLPVLSIDAWADVEPKSWNWNNWTVCAHVPARLEHATTRQLLKYFRDFGLLRHDSQGKVSVERDDVNITFIERATLRPLYAIELPQE